MKTTQLIASTRKQSLSLHEKSEIRAIYYAIAAYNLKAFYKAGSYSNPFTQPHILIKDLVKRNVLRESALDTGRVSLEGGHKFLRYACPEMDAQRILMNTFRINQICLDRGWDYGSVITALAMMCGHGILTGVTRSRVPELAPTLNLIHQGNRHLRGSIIASVESFSKTVDVLLLPNA